MKSLFLLASLVLFSNPSQAARPVIMLTGYWAPTNEMLREFSQNSAQNRGVWRGENWENSGYDLIAFFPEFPKGDSRGEGDFEVDEEDTRRDLDRLTQELRPVALISFGRGQGPWEIEKNFPDFWTKGPTLHSTLPVKEIAQAVNETGALKAWVDTKGDPGDFLCGYISHLGAKYRAKNSSTMQAQGFIHVGAGQRPEEYQQALHATLRALIKSLK